MIYKIVSEKEISERIDKAIRDMLVTCFPHDADHFSRQREWHSAQNWTTLVTDDDGGVCGCIAVIEREIRVGEVTVSVAGIGNVCVMPEYRGLGVIDTAMKCMVDESRLRGLDAGLLMCKPALEKVYGRMGWENVASNTFMHNEVGASVKFPEGNSVMSMAISRDVFPEGDIDLQGRDW